MDKKVLLLLILMFTTGFLLFSEENVPVDDNNTTSSEPQKTSLFDRISVEKEKVQEEGIEDETAVPVLNTAQQIALMEINHFSIEKLRRWVLGLQLPASGTRENLQNQLLQYYDIPASYLDTPVVDLSESEDDVIQIVSADNLESVTVEAINETYLSIQGSVFIQLPGDGDQWMSANSIIYNKDLNIATAYGNVSFQAPDNKSDSPITGGYVSIIGSSDSTIILDGSTSIGENDSLLSGQDFYIQGETILLQNGEVSLRRGSITSDPNDEPYYRIEASRAQTYTDGTFYLQGAALYLGRVPTFYFPFFVYPGKTFSFHPSFGIDSTYGFYMNTTTYVWGKHSKVSAKVDGGNTSIFNFISDSSGDRYYDMSGFYMEPRQTQPARERWAEETGSSLALVADYYTRSGLFAGAFYEKSKKVGPLSSMALSGGIANSYHIYKNGDASYSRFAPGTTERTRFYTYFLGTKIPFRFFWDINLAISLGKVSGSFKMPYYSDPYFEGQFATGRFLEERKQDLTLGELLFNPMSSSREIDRKKTSFQWGLNLSWNPRFSHKLIKGFRVSAFEVNLLWRQYSLSPQPEHIGSSVLYDETVYLPKTLRLPLVSMQLGGTIFEGSIKRSEPKIDRKKVSNSETLSSEESLPNSHRESIAEAYSPESMDNRLSQNETSFDIAGLANRGLKPYDYIGLKYKNPWEKPTSPYMIKEIFSHSLVYRSTGKSENLYHFNYTTLNPEENIMSYKNYAEYNFKGDLSITYKAKFIEDLISLENKVSLSGKYQNYFDRSTMVDENGELFLTDSKWDSITKDQERNTYFWIKNSLSATLRPFFVSDMWGESFITYSLKQNIFDYDYDKEEEVFTPVWHGWTSKEVTNHTLNGSLIFNSKYFRGELNANTSLPPRNNLQQMISPTLSFFMGEYLTLTGDTSFSRVGARPEEESAYTFTKWTQQDYSFTLTGDFPHVYFSEKLTFGVGENKGDVFSTTTLDFKLLQEKFLIKQLLLTDLKEQTISAYQLRLSLYNFESTYEFAKMGVSNDLQLVTSSYRWEHTYNPTPFWRNRFYDITLKPDFLFSIDHLNKFNNSLTIGATIKFKIFEFMDLSFSAHSQNDATFKYFDGTGGFLVKDVLVDVFKSINFFYTPHREESPFKLNSVDLSFIHYMRDWTFTFSLKGDFTYKVDYVDPTLSGFQWIPEYVFAVQWTPLNEMSYNARLYKDEYGEIIIENEKK